MAEQNRMDELFLEFTDARWERMTPEQRLAALQEMENLVALEQGRKPLKVLTFESNDENGGIVLGYFDGAAININERCLNSMQKIIPGVTGGRGMQALNTLLHEGRHAWQEEVACGRIDGVDPEHVTVIRMNFLNYCRGEDSPALYACQPIELDARRFAREYFGAMARRAIEAGHDDACITRQMHNNDTVEINWASMARNTLTVREMEEFEEKALARMREADPETDLSDIKMLREAIEMMESDSGFARYIDGKPLFWKAHRIGEIAASLDAKPDATDDGLDPALRGLLDRLHAPDGAADAVRETPDRLRMGLR